MDFARPHCRSRARCSQEGYCMESNTRDPVQVERLLEVQDAELDREVRAE